MAGFMENFHGWMLKYLLADNLDVTNYKTPQLGLVMPFGIFVNGRDNKEEQIKTVLHEVMHYHPDFMSYTGGLWQNVVSRDETIESEIERRALILYETRKDLVLFIEVQLHMAKESNRRLLTRVYSNHEVTTDRKV